MDPVTPGDAVVVDWVDSHSADGWARLAEIAATPLGVRSIGYVVARSDDAIVLANTVAPYPREPDTARTGAGFMTIPAVAIRDLRVLPGRQEAL